MIDLSIFGPMDLILFGISFIITFLLVATIIKKSPAPSKLRSSSGLILVVTAMSALIIDSPNLLFGLIAVAVLSIHFGRHDEKHEMTPFNQLLAQALIAVIAVLSGWTIQHVTNPLGDGVIDLQWFTFFSVSLPGDLIAIAWIMLLINALNWFDGVDGLAPSVSSVALIFIALVSLLPSIQDSLTLQLAIIGAGPMLAFAIWNWPPAKVILGTSGVWFIASFIGMIAIVSGGKIVTTLLILAIPILDMCLVIAQRLIRRQAPWQGDREYHLHYQLQKLGFTSAEISVSAITATFALGVAALSLQTTSKAVTIILVSVVMSSLVLLLWISRKIKAQ